MKRVLVIALLLVVSLSAVGASQPTSAPQISIWRVFVDDRAEAQALADSGLDMLEGRGEDYLLVLGDAALAADLRADGYQVALDHNLPTGPVFRPDTYYNGYRTVAEHYAHLDDIQTAYPNLVRVVDYGDSWLKTQAISDGWDLRAVCITADQVDNCALTPQSAKPRFVLMAAIHARELSTSEVAWRWMDYLLQGYGSDAEITALLDHNEVWVIPVANPDGRELVESGGNSPYYQRKNMHAYSTSCSDPPLYGGSNHLGVDLNRNASFQWGGAGTSTNPCSAVYRGPSPSSEPEQQALEALFNNLFLDQRANTLDAVAPLTTTGTFISMHSYSNLVLFPWGWYYCESVPCEQSGRAPNDAGLRSLGFRMSYFNGYDTGMPSELLYAASGGTDDYTYGALGVASFTYEIGPNTSAENCGGFMPVYSCQDSRFWPENRNALLYAALTAREPYTMSQGPSITQATITTDTLQLSALADDNVYGAVGSDRPATQAIQAAEYYIDTPPWAGGTSVALAATDGTFNTVAENLSGTINISGLAAGRHQVWIRAQDTDGFWGPFKVLWLDVEQGVAESFINYLPFVTR